MKREESLGVEEDLADVMEEVLPEEDVGAVSMSALLELDREGGLMGEGVMLVMPSVSKSTMHREEGSSMESLCIMYLRQGVYVPSVLSRQTK